MSRAPSAWFRARVLVGCRPLLVNGGRLLVTCGLLLVLVASGCSTVSPLPNKSVDCSVDDAYDLLSYSLFDGDTSNWFQYADNTPGGIPNTQIQSNLPVTQVDPPGRCGDTHMARLTASGHNFYGVGYGDYQHNDDNSRAKGAGYTGISFWARSEPDTDKTFMLYVDDGRTIVLPQTAVDGGPPVLGPGEIAPGTQCRLPPPQSLGTPACYGGGILPPATATRVPVPDECGNQFHTYVTTTEDWQFFLIPFGDLAQWPCPNRLDGGIDPNDIADMQIKFLQGTNYDVWLDDIQFYRPRADGGP